MTRELLVAAMLAGVVACSEAPQDANKEARAEPEKAEKLDKVEVNGVTLHYRERGRGETIIFVHGSLGDYREWAPVAEALSDDFRTITYSRRYNFPNDNLIAGGNHSPLVEARDLAALVRKVADGPVHIVGASYGGFTSLVLALEHGDLVRTLTVAEPPVVSWLPDLPGGKAEYDRIYDELIGRAAEAFREGEPDRALRVTMDFFAGPGALDTFPPEVAELLRANLKEWRAIVTSDGPLPPVSRQAVKALEIPVLMIGGGRTHDFHKMIDAELERLLTDVSRKTVPDATHNVCMEAPETCAAAIRAHLTAE